jgi:hypothetical protein
LLAALKGDAFSKLQLVDAESLRKPDGVVALLGLLREGYEPLAHRKVGQVMDHFLYSFKRGTEEGAMDFSFRFDKELAEAQQAVGELAPCWVAHLFLRKLNLRPEQEVMILASSLGVYTLEALRPDVSHGRGIAAGRQQQQGGALRQPDWHSVVEALPPRWPVRPAAGEQ